MVLPLSLLAAQWRCETQALLTASSSNRRLNSQTPAVLCSYASAPELLERPHIRKKKKEAKSPVHFSVDSLSFVSI